MVNSSSSLAISCATSPKTPGFGKSYKKISSRSCILSIRQNWRTPMLKTRLFGLALVIIFAGLIYYGWYQLREEGVYYIKVAAFSPVGVVGGLFLMLFPNMGGKPDMTKQKIIVMVVFAIGIVAGLVNWFLMDPGFFGFSSK